MEVMFYSWGEQLGDGLVKLPAIAAARQAFPDARIVWCAIGGRTVYAGSLKALAAPLIDEVVTPAIAGARWRDLIAPLPFDGRQFDIVIDTQRLVVPALVAKRSAKGLFVSAAAGFAFSDRRPEQAWPEPVVEQVAALIGLAAGCETPPAPVAVSDPRLHAAARHLLPDGPRYVGFATGAGGKEKIWPLERFLALARGVAARGDRAVFFVGPEEQGDLAAIRAALPDALLPEWDRTDPFADVKGPLLAVALSARLAAGVANDSGVGHALALGGAPLLSLQISSRKARKFRPAAARLELLVADTFGGGMEAIPLAAAAEKLDLLLTEQR